MTGAPNTLSSSLSTWRGRDADEERMKRRGLARIAASFLPARERIVWCMVGTALYQVGLASSSQAKKLKALKPGVQNTLPPAATEASTVAISP